MDHDFLSVLASTLNRWLLRTVQRRASAAGFLCLALCAVPALAQPHAETQGYPSRPIRIIVANTAGSAMDNVTRIIGQRLTEAWGQQVVVDNRPGANTMIGTQLAVKSRPDGYTLVSLGNALAGASTFDLRTRRDVANMNVLYSATPNVDLAFVVRNTEKNGGYPWGGSFGIGSGIASEMPTGSSSSSTNSTSSGSINSRICLPM